MEQRPVPTPRAGDVLVRVTSVGVCGSDTHYYRHGRIGSFVVDAPLVLGHEAAGTIVGVGESVDPSRIGQRVSIEPQRPDPDSAETRRGDYNLCPHMRFFGTPPIDGALCDYVTIGAAFAHAGAGHRLRRRRRVVRTVVGGHRRASQGRHRRRVEGARRRRRTHRHRAGSARTRLRRSRNRRVRSGRVAP